MLCCITIWVTQYFPFNNCGKVHFNISKLAYAKPWQSAEENQTTGLQHLQKRSPQGVLQRNLFLKIIWISSSSTSSIILALKHFQTLPNKIVEDKFLISFLKRLFYYNTKCCNLQRSLVDKLYFFLWSSSYAVNHMLLNSFSSLHSSVTY